MGCVMAEARHLQEIRPILVSLAIHQRIHFNNESDRQKRVVLAAITEMPIGISLFVCNRGHGITEFSARAACLARIVEVVQAAGVSRLVIESRADDREDERVLARARNSNQVLVFEHRSGKVEPMLWVADAVTWALGAGPKWRRLVSDANVAVVVVRP